MSKGALLAEFAVLAVGATACNISAWYTKGFPESDHFMMAFVVLGFMAVGKMAAFFATKK